MIATTPHQAGPADRLVIWALSEIPPILGFTKNATFSNFEISSDLKTSENFFVSTRNDRAGQKTPYI